MKTVIGILIVLEALLAGIIASIYNVEIIEVRGNTTTPNAIDVDFHTVQISRGVKGMSGHLYLKEEINIDRGMSELKVYYSSNGISYQLAPYRIPPISGTQAFNGPYKQYLMDGFVEYCTDAMAEEEYVSPLRKYNMECENFRFNSENFPSHLRPGYYKLLMNFNDLPEVYLELFYLVKIESEWL